MKNNIRPMQVSDLDAIDRIQQRSYPSHFQEPMSLFEQIITAYPQGNFVFEQDDQIAAYIMSNPISDDMQDGFEGGCPELTGEETRLYLHDLCLDPDWRGQGIAQRLVAHLWEFAEKAKFKDVYGVAVQGSFPFWEKMGFSYVAPYDYDGTDGILMEKAL